MRKFCPRWWCLGWLKHSSENVWCTHCSYRRPLVNEALIP